MAEGRDVITEVSPFPIEIPPDEIEALRERLIETRWAERQTVDDWSQGVPLHYLRELCTYWRMTYNWRFAEAQLNAFRSFRTPIDGCEIWFLHSMSPHREATPLIMTHGWPGSVWEFHKVIGPLIDPVAFGGEAEDAFHVVCPSLPGYGFSDKPDEPGWGVERIADAWVELMRRLGYDRFGAQGGDWGSMVSTAIATRHPEKLIGIHLNMAIAIPDPSDATPEEQAALAALEEHRQWGTGYSKQQSTRPQTLGYGLVDSPAMQCAWIVEKFWEWVDHDGKLEDVISTDELLDNVMLYWMTATGASSARLYWESFRSPNLDPVDVPTGISVFPKEIFRVSRRWAETRFSDLRYFNEPPRGGHFAAMEQPELFVEEVRAAFRAMR